MHMSKMYHFKMDMLVCASVYIYEVCACLCAGKRVLNDIRYIMAMAPETLSRITHIVCIRSCLCIMHVGTV